MNKPFFASALGRWVAPAVLALATFVGTIGFSSVASAQQIANPGAPAPVMQGARPHRVIVPGPRVVLQPPFVAPAYPYDDPVPYGRYGHGWRHRWGGHGWGGHGWRGHGWGGHGGGFHGHGRYGR